MRHRCSVHTALVWLLGVGLFATAAAAVPGGAQGGIAPSVEQWLREAAAGERVATWVFLRDKGARSADDVERDLRRVASAVDPAALERRLRARPETPFDQADLPLYKPYLEALEAEGVSFRAFSRWLNAVSIEADRDQVERVAGLPFVKGVRRVSGRAGGPRTELVDLSAKEMTPLYDYGFAWTQLDQIQIPALHSEGYTGSGVRVALLDTGFWLEHETFSNLNLIAQHDFINDDDTTANQPGDPPGQHDHGTMCLSLLAGQSPGIMMGGAFDAEYILAKTENIADEQPIEEDWWIEALEWADSLGAQLVSSSLCYTDWYTYEDMDGDTAPITNAADQGAINGIVIVNAAGNAGASEWKYIEAPADGDSVVTVGSVDSLGVRSSFSSQGPTYDGRIKPTVMAMGQATFIASTSSTTAYRRGNGTSFATPLTAAAITLILEKQPLWQPGNVIEAITLTATQSSHPDSLYGWGILQARDASNHIASGVSPRDAVTASLRVYPNPCGAGFYVSFTRAPETAPGPVSVYDVAGRLVCEAPSPASGVGWVDLPVSGAAPGMVFVRVPGRGTAKVLVVR